MQAPTTLSGLRESLRSEGYVDLFLSSKEDVLAQIDWRFAHSDKTAQDQRRHDRAVRMVSLFDWDVVAMNQETRAKIASVLSAAADVLDLGEHRRQKNASKRELQPHDRMERTRGEKYNKEMDIKEIAGLFRRELISLAKRGVIPKFKYSVRLKRYSGGQSVNITFKSGRDDIEDLYNLPALVAATMQKAETLNYRELPRREKEFQFTKDLEKRINEYNFSDSIPNEDYLRTNFFANVSVDPKDYQRMVKDAVRAVVQESGETGPLVDQREFKKDPVGLSQQVYAPLLRKQGYNV